MKQTIITIGRQFGAGGREMGKRLAETLGIPYYDKELLAEAAKISGLSSDYLERRDKCSTSSLLYSFVMGTRTLTGQPSLEELAWKAQRDAVEAVARQGGCVIVGRCADVILRDNRICFGSFSARTNPSAWNGSAAATTSPFKTPKRRSTAWSAPGQPITTP